MALQESGIYIYTSVLYSEKLMQCVCLMFSCVHSSIIAV